MRDELRPSASSALAFYLLSIAGLIFMGLWYSNPYSSLMTTLPLILYQGVLFALPPLLYYRRHPQARPALRLNPLDPITAALIVLAALLGVIVLNLLSYYWLLLLDGIGLAVNTGNSSAPRTIQQLLLMIAAMAIAPAVTEEIMFRGFMLPSLEQLGRKTSIFLCTLLFTLLHSSAEGFPAHFILGIILALLVIKTGSLHASILFHGVYNAYIMVLAYSPTPQGSSDLPTLAEMLTTLPSMVVLAVIWFIVLAVIFRRGAANSADTLPDAKRAPLTLRTTLLLALCIVIMAAFLIYTIVFMAQGGRA